MDALLGIDSKAAKPPLESAVALADWYGQQDRVLVDCVLDRMDREPGYDPEVDPLLPSWVLPAVRARRGEWAG